jgi:hypothetical protein
VIVGPEVQSGVVGLAEQAVEVAEPLVRLLEAAGIEEILFLAHDHDRLGGERGDEVGVIEAEGEGARRALLGVGWQLVLEVAAEGRHETARRSHGETRLDAAEPGGLRAAAGIAGEARGGAGSTSGRVSR